MVELLPHAMRSDFLFGGVDGVYHIFGDKIY